MFDSTTSTERRARIAEAARAAYRDGRRLRAALRGAGAVAPVTEYLAVWERESLRDRLRGALLIPRARDEARAGRDDWWPEARLGLRRLPARIGLAVAEALAWLPLPRLPAGPRRVAAAALLTLMAAGTLHLAAPAASEAAAQSLVRLVTPHGPGLVTRLEARLDCATRIAVRDATGALIGWTRKRTHCRRPLAGRLEPPADWPETPDFRTAPVPPEQAERFGRIIEVVEGEHTRGPATLSGFNLLGLGRALESLPGALCCGQPLVGGSNGILTGVKALHSDPGQAGWRDKIRYAGLNLVLGAHALREDAPRHRWAVMTLTAAQGAGGSRFGPPVAGGLLPHVVFGKQSFAELSTAELCVLAAGIKRHIRIVSVDSPDGARADARVVNEAIRARAITRCIDPLEARGSVTAGEARAMRAEIQALRFPVGARAATVNPDLALRAALPGARSLVTDMLVLEPRAGEDGTVDVTVTSTGQRRLAAWVPGYEASIAPRLGPGLCLVDCPPGARRPDMLAVAVELGAGGRDAVATAWQGTSGLFTGPSAEGGVSRPHRSAGSLPKLLAAPLFVEAGIRRLCRRAWADLHDAGGHAGYPCTEDAHFLELAEAIARSSNLAYAEAIRRVGTARVRAWFEGLGLAVGDRASEALLRRSIASGENVAASPRVLLRALAALARGAMGEAPVAAPASVVGWTAPEAAGAVDLTELGIGREALLASAPVLAAPLTAPEGTLHSLLAPLREIGCSREGLLGKSGTSEAVGPRGTEVRDKMVVLHAVCGGRRYAVFAMIGSPRVDLPLGSVRTEDVGRLALAVLEAAVATAPMRAWP